MEGQHQRRIMQAKFDEWYHRNFVQPMCSDLEWAEKHRRLAQDIYFAGYRMGVKYGDGAGITVL